MLYQIAQKIMMQIDPEKIHNWVLGFLNKTGNSQLSWLYRQNLKASPIKVMGITFPNCIGLAAGLDKDGEAIDAFHQMGFGHVEVGTVTPLAQPGNPQPRMFRIKSKKAIVNRMGFNNKGVDNLVRNLEARKSSIIVGVNIGKNKATDHSAPIRIESLISSKSIKKDYEYILATARLLPNYGFPVGLNVVDKFAKIPNWMSKASRRYYATHLLKQALKSKDQNTISLAVKILSKKVRSWRNRPLGGMVR